MRVQCWPSKHLHASEATVPLQVLHLLACLPQDAAFLSIYESGSTDATGTWLMLLEALATALAVPHRVVIGGNLTRMPDQERIEFLAAARNAALEPLWAPAGQALQAWATLGACRAELSLASTRP